MTQQVEALYENGVFRPLQRLCLKDSARVKVSVSGDAPDALAELID